MGKHLTLSDRALIERCLVNGYTFAAIARKLNRSPTTISREVKARRVFVNQINSVHDNHLLIMFAAFAAICVVVFQDVSYATKIGIIAHNSFCFLLLLAARSY